MRIEFGKLFEVVFYHTYYSSGTGDDFEIEPAFFCQSLLRSYGLLLKKTPRGFVILYEITRDELGDPHPLIPIDEELKLSFILKPKNSYFLNYSDLPLDSDPDYLYRLHNLNDNEQGGDLLLSSATDKNHLSLVDRTTLKSQFFHYSFDSINPSAKIEVLDELETVIIKHTVTIDEGRFNYPLDLLGRTPGLYTLWIDGVKRIEFYASDELVGTGAFGVIDIFSNDHVPEEYRFLPPGQDSHPVYMMNIERRQTFWKYHVAFKNYEIDSKFNSIKLSVNHPDSLINFIRQGVFDESDDIPTEIFISDTELSLTEVPVKGIDLKLKKSGGGGGGGSNIDLKKNLPNPSIRMVKPDESGSNVYSEMFIYL